MIPMRCKTCGRTYFAKSRDDEEGGFGHRAVAGHWPTFAGYVDLDAPEDDEDV